MKESRRKFIRGAWIGLLAAAPGFAVAALVETKPAPTCLVGPPGPCGPVGEPGRDGRDGKSW